MGSDARVLSFEREQRMRRAGDLRMMFGGVELSSGKIGPMSAIFENVTASCSTRISEMSSRKVSSGRNAS